MERRPLFGDPFTGTGALGAGWADGRSGAGPLCVRDNGQVSGDTNAGHHVAYRTGESYPVDQYVQITIKVVVDSASYVGVVLRFNDPGDATLNCYRLITDGVGGAGHTTIVRYVNGSPTGLGNIAQTWSADDTLEFEAQEVAPTGLFAYKNGVLVWSYADHSDSDVQSGAAAVWIYDDDAQGDDFQSGYLSTKTVVPVRRPI